jgi:PASTA domain
MICFPLALLFVSVAAASADSLGITVATATPEQAVPVTLQLSGSTAHGASLLAVARPAGGIACQPTYESDQTAAAGANRTLFDYGEADENPGSFSEQATYKPQNPGSYLVCAWLQSTNGANAVTAGPISATFSARSPQVAQLTVALASNARPRQGFQIAYTTQTDQDLNLYSVAKRAGGLPCAASYELEQQQNQVEDVIYDYGEAQVFGGPTTTTATTTEDKAGPYVICTWVEGPNNDEVDAATSTPIYVGSPPQPPACQVPKLTVGAALAKVKHRILLNHCAVGTITHGYSRTVPRGRVMSLSPAPGSKLASGAAVGIKISAGRAPAPCRVPRFRRGSTLRAVKHAIIADHCTVGAVKHRYDRKVRRGTVISVSPRPGTRHTAHARVRITVSAGPKPRRHAAKSHVATSPASTTVSARSRRAWARHSLVWMRRHHI